MFNIDFDQRRFLPLDFDLEDLILTYGGNVPSPPALSLNGFESGYSSLASTPGTEIKPFDWPPIIQSPGILNGEDKDPAEGAINLSPITSSKSILHEPKIGTSFSGQPVTFKIDVGEPIVTPNSSIKTCVIGPSEKPIPVNQEIDYLTNQLVCTFKSYENGVHTVIASEGNNNLLGSPFRINVARNYDNVDWEHPIVTIDMELMDENSPKSYQRRKPWGLTVDTKIETIYAADRELHEILAYGPDGLHLFSFGTRGYGQGEFRRPTGVAFDRVNDRIHVTDKDNHRIQFFNPTGTYLGGFGSMGQGCGEFYYPWGIAVSPDGNQIAVADSRNHRIQLITKDGQFLRKFYPRAKKSSEEKNDADIIGWQYPRGVTFDNSGQYLYVSDFNNNGIFKLHISFTDYEKFAFGGLKRPSGTTVDEAGNVLVCDQRDTAIKIYSPLGKPLKDIRRIGSEPIDLPTDLALLKGGYLVTLDGNGKIRII